MLIYCFFTFYSPLRKINKTATCKTTPASQKTKIDVGLMICIIFLSFRVVNMTQTLTIISEIPSASQKLNMT